jgi:hypothetical protein
VVLSLRAQHHGAKTIWQYFIPFEADLEYRGIQAYSTGLAQVTTNLVAYGWLYMAYLAIFRFYPPFRRFSRQGQRSMPSAMMCVLPVYTFHVFFSIFACGAARIFHVPGPAPGRPIFHPGGVPSEYRNTYCAHRVLLNQLIKMHHNPDHLTPEHRNPG